MEKQIEIYVRKLRALGVDIKHDESSDDRVDTQVESRFDRYCEDVRRFGGIREGLMSN